MCHIHSTLCICIFFAAGDDGDCGILTAMGGHNVWNTEETIDSNVKWKKKKKKQSKMAILIQLCQHSTPNKQCVGHFIYIQHCNMALFQRMTMRLFLFYNLLPSTESFSITLWKCAEGF